MLILALDTSGKTATTALYQDDLVVADFTTHVALTHSQTILPMVEALFQNTGLALSAVDVFVAATGPGSFTGLRIGVSAIKGLAFAGEKPCMGFSSLEALAQNLQGRSGLFCPAMDARRDQVYTGLFESGDGGVVRRLTPDQAISIEALGQALLATGKPVTLLGDGANLCLAALGAQNPALRLADAPNRFQNAASLCTLAAFYHDQPGRQIDAADLAPVYLRLSQAERERQERA